MEIERATMGEAATPYSDKALFEAAFEHASMGAVLLSRDLRILRANRAFAHLIGRRLEELQGLDVVQIAEQDEQNSLREKLAALPTDASALEDIDARFLRADGKRIWVHINAAPIPASTGLSARLVVHIHDITLRKRLDMERALTAEVFNILDRIDDPDTAARLLLSATRRAVGVEAGAIRLAREGDFTYATQEGFPDDFISAENCLRALDEKGVPQVDENGRPLLECTCGLVLMGKTDPTNPIFTSTGCVCVNDSSAEPDPRLHVEDLRIGARNRCLHSGYRSVTLVPIRTRNAILGLLQLNDHRPDQFPPDLVAFLETIASSIGIALERKHTGERLREKEARYRELFERSPVAMWEEDLSQLTTRFEELRREGIRDLGLYMEEHPETIQDLSGRIRILAVNRAAVKMMGAKSNAELMANLKSFSDVAGGDTFVAKLSRLFAGDECFEAETSYRNLLGQHLDLHLRLAVLWGAAGTPARALVSFTDLTAHNAAENRRRELEREVDHLQRLESLGRLAGGLSHDINNVLGVVMAVASLMKEEHANTPAIARDADSMLKAAEHGRSLVKALRDFSRKELESATEVDLNEIIRREAGVIERTSLKRIAVHLDLAPDLPRVFGEAGSIQTALMNLCVNALDAMPNQGTLTVRSRCGEKKNVEIVFEDSGEGMPPAVLARACEPFFTTKPIGKGTGLGLAQVYGTMKAHGGTIAIDSSVGAGTRILLSFPTMPKTPAHLPPSSTPAPEILPRLAILVVDDEDLVRDSTMALVKSLGHSAQAVSSGVEAIAWVESEMPVDAVLLDINMPGMDGIETLGRLRILRPSLRTLIVTGFADERLPSVHAQYPDVRTLLKPFTRDELAHALADLATSPAIAHA